MNTFKMTFLSLVSKILAHRSQSAQDILVCDEKNCEGALSEIDLFDIMTCQTQVCNTIIYC